MTQSLNFKPIWIWFVALYIFLTLVLLFSGPKGYGILFLNSLHHPNLNAFFIVITKSVETSTYIILPIILVFFHIRKSLLIGLTGLLVISLSSLLKLFFAQPRPIEVLPDSTLVTKPLNFIINLELHTGFSSFPSGHTTSAFALMGLFAFWLTKNQKVFLLILAIWAYLIAVSRIYLFQHFLLDTIGGAVLGTLILMMLYTIDKKVFQSSKNKWFDQNIVSLITSFKDRTKA